MSKSNFSDEFKQDAVHQIVERGDPVASLSLGDAHSSFKSGLIGHPPIANPYGSGIFGPIPSGFVLVRNFLELRFGCDLSGVRVQSIVPPASSRPSAKMQDA